MMEEIFGGEGGKLKVVLNQKFWTVPPDEQEDILQESYLIALRRGLLYEPLTWWAATTLLLDAYRSVRKPRGQKMKHFPTDPDKLTELADPPNQWADMEVRNKMLSPEEQEFQEWLEGPENANFNVSLATETRFLLNSMPFTLRELAGHCKR